MGDDIQQELGGDRDDRVELLQAHRAFVSRLSAHRVSIRRRGEKRRRHRQSAAAASD